MIKKTPVLHLYETQIQDESGRIAVCRQGVEEFFDFDESALGVQFVFYPSPGRNRLRIQLPSCLDTRELIDGKEYPIDEPLDLYLHGLLGPNSTWYVEMHTFHLPEDE